MLLTVSTKIYDDITSMIIDQLYVGQSIQMKNTLYQINYEKNNINNSNLITQKNLQDCQIIIPSFCALLNLACSNRIITQKVIFNGIGF